MIAQEKVKRWRVEHGLTIAQMARQLRISETLLYIVEDGGDYDPERYLAPADIADRAQKRKEYRQ